ncbi:hypothetical protein SAMN05216223_108247 [Actinacidiphila yanglinensis]|uniref:Uncharacterized protein n=1 Tax=Actinacidiphila yanglinensis TaxID=310779 RepID=A0A1H6CBF6_9ACTN|nr:hypothetical protein [Actinacidiphila yanglinensis]SEG70183.1 hypothetical protein SAMN05216223_108247 [Actinacidiphila yanglinensis]
MTKHPDAPVPRHRIVPETPAPTVPVRSTAAALVAGGVLAVALVALTDGVAAAGTALVLLSLVGLGIVRYVAGSNAQDSGYRKAVRLLGSRAPALGEWQRIVDHSLGRDGAVPFATTLRPQLQRLFASRLAERHGIDLYRAPQRATALVGEAWWPWIDPAQPPPAPELPEAVLAGLLDRLEAL